MNGVVILVRYSNMARGDGKYVQTYDLNNDGAINMSDVIKIAAKFNTIVQ